VETKEKFDNTREVIRSRKSRIQTTQWKKEKWQMENQRSTIHYMEN